jgi:amino acid transporter
VASAQVEERELLRAMSWYDGFVVAMANPTFLLTSLGLSVTSLGGWGAIIVWLISVGIGGLHNNLYAELAAMFPKLAGGVAIFAHEAWKRYTSFVGPIAAFGYWIGWSVVLAISGLIVGQLLQNQFYTGSLAAGSSWTHHQSLILGVNFDLNFPIIVGIVLIACIWVANVFGVRPAVWVGYVTGGLLLFPLAVLIIVPYITGDWSSSHLHNNIHPLSSLTGGTGIRLVIVWLYIMCWSSYGFECCATFAPEYKDPARDTARALRAAAVFSIFVYGLLPLGAVGTFGDKNITAGNALFFYGDVFKTLVGSALADVLVLMLCAGIVLSMNTATMDGSRALYGISQDGMTFRFLGRLNARNVPGNAMTLDAVLNVILLVCAIGAVGGGYLKVLAVSNFGYVLAHLFAISGFLLLRRDRPNWPRPIKVGSGWIAVAWFCLVYDFILLVVGAISFKLTGYGSSWSILAWSLVVPVFALVAYIWRVVVEDKKPLQWKLPAPTTLEEEAALHAAGVQATTT